MPKVKKSPETLSKPKRPISAYNFFVKTERAKIVAESSAGDESVSFENIGREIGKRWREISHDELAQYKALAKQDSERYKHEMHEYYENEVGSLGLGLGINDAKPKTGEDDHNDPAVGLLQMDHSSSNLATSRASSVNVGGSNPTMELLREGTRSSNERASASAGVAAAPLGSHLTSVPGLHPPASRPRADEIFASLQSNEAVRLILAERGFIQQRQIALMTELHVLTLKKELLDAMLAREAGTGLHGNALGSMPLVQPGQLLQSTQHRTGQGINLAGSSAPVAPAFAAALSPAPQKHRPQQPSAGVAPNHPSPTTREGAGHSLKKLNGAKKT